MSLTIVAPPYMGQMFFKTKHGGGFSETYWVKGASYNEAMTKLIEVYAMRRTLFTASHRCVYLRVSDSTKKRDTQIISPTTTAAGTYVPTAGDTEVDEAALLQRFEGVLEGVPYFILKPLRLIPEECVTDTEYTPTVAFSEQITEFHNIVAENCQIVVKAGDPPTPTKMDIINKLAQRMSRRKVGRPFGQSRGRSLAP